MSKMVLRVQSPAGPYRWLARYGGLALAAPTALDAASRVRCARAMLDYRTQHETSQEPPDAA
jgi:hypothetical protein